MQRVLVRSNLWFAIDLPLSVSAKLNSAEGPGYLDKLSFALAAQLSYRSNRSVHPAISQL